MHGMYVVGIQEIVSFVYFSIQISTYVCAPTQIDIIPNFKGFLVFSTPTREWGKYW